jgi:hypothetical protein
VTSGGTTAVPGLDIYVNGATSAPLVAADFHFAVL